MFKAGVWRLIGQNQGFVVLKLCECFSTQSVPAKLIPVITITYEPGMKVRMCILLGTDANERFRADKPLDDSMSAWRADWRQSLVTTGCG